MKLKQLQYKNLFISKFNEDNINKINKINKINFTVTTNSLLKFVFKNIIWLFLLISGQQINFYKQKIKRKTSSKITLTSFNLTLRKKNFFVIDKILTIILPNQENRIVKPIKWNKNLIISFQKCLTYSEIDIIIKNKMNMLIKNFHLILKFNFLNSNFNKDFFLLRFLQFPIKK